MFVLLNNLTVTDINAIGRILGLPEDLIKKIPQDGLTDKSDAENLEFLYSVLDCYIRNGIIYNELN